MSNDNSKALIIWAHVVSLRFQLKDSLATHWPQEVSSWSKILRHSLLVIKMSWANLPLEQMCWRLKEGLSMMRLILLTKPLFRQGLILIRCLDPSFQSWTKAREEKERVGRLNDWDPKVVASSFLFTRNKQFWSQVLWLWISWLSCLFRHQRYPLRILALAKF